MVVLVDEEYGMEMIKIQAKVLPELQARHDQLLVGPKTSVSARAMCALDLVIRRHEQRLKP